VPFRWSEATASELGQVGRPVTFYAYPSADHLFEGAEFKQAIKRDTAFFRKLMK
jgi:hypothetical protein